MRQISILFLLMILSASGIADANNRFVNYSSTICVSDFLRIGNNLYVASSGGIYSLNLQTSSSTLMQSKSNNPDPNITALCSVGNSLWAGSSQGYLYKQTPPGNTLDITTYNGFFSAGWKILDLISYGKYLIVASNKGLSIVNTENGYTEKNASKFGSLISNQVNVLKIHNNVLYAGLNDGVAICSLSVHPLDKVNFYDPTTWTINKSVETPVRSFVVANGTCIASSGYSDIFNGHMITGKDSALFAGTKQLCSVPGTISSLKVTAANECWIGTHEDYFFLWNGTELSQYTIPGPTVSSFSRILVDSRSNVWALPYFKGNTHKWWGGISALINDNWKSFTISTMNDSSFYMGDFFTNYGLDETPDGRIWFGTSGAGIKCFSYADSSWKFFEHRAGDDSVFFSSDKYDMLWSKCDAFTLDSSGYLWVSRYGNNAGSLICYDYRYDPDNSQTVSSLRHYRNYFPSSSQYHNLNFRCLHTDNNGNIFAGGEQGDVVVFRHNGNPLEDNSITVLKSMQTDSVFDMATMDNGKTYIATSDSLFVYNPDSNTISVDNEFKYTARYFASESDDILWIGTPANGIVRYNVSSNDHIIYTTASGLISNNIRDLSIDRKNGFLWIATDTGISKLDIGYSVVNNLSGSNMEVFPNPFSISKMKQAFVTIRNIPKDSKVAIYNSNGQLVAKPKLDRKGNGTSYSWKPENIVPGVYQIVVKCNKGPKSKLFMVTP